MNPRHAAAGRSVAGAGTGLLAVLAFPLLAACAADDSPRREEQRDLPAFRAIEFDGAGRLDVLVGGPQSVTLLAPERTLRDLATDVRDGTLRIGAEREGRFANAGDIEIRIMLPALDSLALNGAGRISVNGLAGGATRFVVSGAGELEALGSVDRLTVRVNGAGAADLSRLEARDADVTLNGAGNVKVLVRGELDATINGVGAITYGGSPAQVRSSVNGLGTVREASAP